MKPQVIMVDQKEMVCFEPNMVYATPLSAIYLNNVREVMDAFKTVSDAKQAEMANAASDQPNNCENVT
jgi:hypothetical protein